MCKKLRIAIRIVLIPLWLLIFIIYIPIWFAKMAWYYFDFSDYKVSYLFLLDKIMAKLRL